MDAILPLVGVLLGGVIAVGGNEVRDRLNARRDARAAARLVRVEVEEILVFVLAAPDVPGSWQAIVDFEPTAWDSKRKVLARSLSTETFYDVARAYHDVRRIAVSGVSAKLTPENLSALHAVEDSLVAAAKALEPLAGIEAQQQAETKPPPDESSPDASAAHPGDASMSMHGLSGMAPQSRHL